MFMVELIFLFFYLFILSIAVGEKKIFEFDYLLVILAL